MARSWPLIHCPRIAMELNSFKIPKSAFAGVVINRQQSAQVITYFPRQNLARRLFDIGAGDISRSAISISNLTYVSEKRRIIFDLKSSYPFVTINDNDDLQFQIGSHIHSKQFGATVALELSDTFHALTAFPVERQRKHEEFERALDNCKADALSSNKEEGDLFACYRSQTNNLKYDRQSLTIFEWAKSYLREVSVENCDTPYWVRDPSKKIFFTTCQVDLPGRFDGTKRTSGWLSVHKTPFEERVYLFEGECRDISMFNLKVSSNDALTFELQTECTKIVMSDRVFELVSNPAHKRIHAIYELAFDKDGLPLSLRPLGSLSQK